MGGPQRRATRCYSPDTFLLTPSPSPLIMRAMRPHGSLDSIALVLDGLARRLGLETKLLEARLRREWTEIVGEQIAAHTRPDQIRFKKLVIHVRHSVWLHQLTFLKPTLLQKINGAAGAPLVAELVLRIGDVADHTGGIEAGEALCTATTPSSQVKAEAEFHAQAVQDLSLRDHLASVMAQALARSKPVS
jgi:Dna[CI] antecedent, DciA